MRNIISGSVGLRAYIKRDLWGIKETPFRVRHISEHFKTNKTKKLIFFCLVDEKKRAARYNNKKNINFEMSLKIFYGWIQKDIKNNF